MSLPSASQRLFIAVPISPELLRLPNGRRSALANVLRELSFCGRAVKPEVPEKLHITLKFLGETDASLIPEIRSQLAEIAAASSAFPLTLQGLGVFPDVKRPAVCWAGVRSPDAISALAGAIESAISPLGFPRERRPFHPHLTLARIRAKPASELFELLHQHTETNFGTDQIESLCLMRSSYPAPGLYQVVDEWRLGTS